MGTTGWCKTLMGCGFTVYQRKEREPPSTLTVFLPGGTPEHLHDVIPHRVEAGEKDWNLKVDGAGRFRSY